MFRLIFLFVLLGIGLFVGSNFSDQQGYALISIAGYTIEMSVVTLILAIIALLAVLFLIEFIIKKVVRAGSHTWNWFSVRKRKHSLRNTNEGVIKLLEGDWQGAEKKVTRWAQYHDMPLLCYLVASEAAQGMGDEEKRDKYLALAKEQTTSTLAIDLTQAKQYVRTKQYQRAADLLEDLVNDHPNNPVILGLLKESYVNVPCWKKLDELLPKLRKKQLISDAEADALFYQAQFGLMGEVAEQKGIEGLLAHWSYLPKKLKQEPQMVEAIVHKLIEREGDSEAYIIIRDALKSAPDDRLFKLLTQLKLPDVHPAILLLEKHLKKNPEDAAALSAQGQLYMREQKWPEAQQAFEQALMQRINVSDYAFLADTLEKQDLKQAAGEVSRKALSLIEQQKALPVLGA